MCELVKKDATLISHVVVPCAGVVARSIGGEVEPSLTEGDARGASLTQSIVCVHSGALHAGVVEVGLVAVFGNEVVVVIGSVVDDALEHLSHSASLTMVVEILCP